MNTPPLNLPKTATFVFPPAPPARQDLQKASNCQFDASLLAAAGKNLAAIGGCHARPKTMFPFSFFN